MRTIKDPIQEAFNRDRRNKRRRDKRHQLAQAQPPKPVYEPVATVDTTVDAIKVPDPIDIGQGSEYEYLRPENQDADDTSSDADDFSAADEEPEPEPGPELTLTYTVREGYLCHFATSWDSRNRLLCSSAGVLRQVAESRAMLCPKCASPNPEGGRTCPVTIITWDQPVCVKVPVSWCSPCGAPYNMRPTELDCLPDSKTGWNLNLHRDSQHVLWWHQPLLQVFDLVSYKSKHLSADAFCSALLDNWEQNSISRPASVYSTTLRQRLRQAFLLYLDCQGLVDDYPEGALSDWPRGALNGCPCCGDINTRSSTTAIGGGVATTIPAACSDGDVGAVAAVEGLEPGGERAAVAAGSHLGAGDGDVTVPEWVPTAGNAGGPVDAEEGAAAEGLEPGGERAAVAAGSHLGAGDGDVTVPEWVPTAGNAGGPVDAEEGAAAEGLEPGGERAAVAAGSHPRGGGGGASAFPARSASKDGLVAAAVSTGTAAIGVAALASAEWLLRDICSPEAAGPGPSILHSVHFDACFKLNLLAHKGYSPSYRQLGRRRYFLPNSSIQQVLSDGHASQQIGVTHCSNFNADKVLAAESRKNLITAVGVALCRHGMLLRLMNLFSGERHAYSTAAALSFLAAGTAVQYWWYDIACRWGKSYTKWLERQTPDLQRLGRELRPLIPPWHRYAHSYACQKAFGHLGVRGVGQGTGEPAEIFNSVAGPHGRITQYMNPVTREAHLERVARLYCRDVLRDLPARLWRMRTRAEAALDSTQERIRVLGATLKELGGDATTVQQRFQEQPPQPVAANTPPASPAAEYARCRLALEKLQREDMLDASSDVVRLGLLFPGADAVPVRQRPALLRTIRCQAAELERSHSYDPAFWGPGSELMNGALEELAKGELRKLFMELEDAVADVHALEHVVGRLSGRRHQQLLAIKEKGRARQRFLQLWEKLESWSAVPGAVTPELKQALAQKGVMGSVLHKQQYPWVAQQSRGVPRLEARLFRVLQEEARCKEELVMIQEEVDRAVEFYGRRVFLLEAAARNVPPNSSHGRLLFLHLAQQQRMLEGFTLLRTSKDVPK